MDERSAEKRFWVKVNKDGPTPKSRPDIGPCWVWTGAKSREGYGRFRVEHRLLMAHRWSYETNKGPIPRGMMLDHLCRNPSCVNHKHLEAVSPRENVMRGDGFTAINAVKTHCPQGHPYIGGNLYVDPRGRRRCTVCRNASSRLSKVLKRLETA